MMKMVTLGDRLSLDDKTLSRDITCLLEVADAELFPENTTKKLINILRRNGYDCIEDIVNASEKEIRLLKYIGLQTFNTLKTLLMELSESERSKNSERNITHSSKVTKGLSTNSKYSLSWNDRY